MKKFILGAAILVLPLIYWAGALGDINETNPQENAALMKTHQSILKNYETVSHINPDELGDMQQDDYLVFDVREKAEFDVSHLKNAIWVDPATDAEDFNDLYGAQIQGKSVILYCSVGVRSSRLAERLLAGDDNPATRIYNLENGVFGWHNEGRPLYSAADPTDYVHPYDRKWGRMVNRDALKRYDRQAPGPN